MSLKTSTGYSALQITLHWGIAVLVFSQLLSGDSMTAALNAALHHTAVTPAHARWAQAHYWLGIIILALAAVRLVIRVAVGAPPALLETRWLQTATRISHALFYVFLLATPVLGLLGYYLAQPLIDLHLIAKSALFVLIVLHICLALYHHFIRRDATLRRMWLPTRREHPNQQPGIDPSA